jgi:hypothetical protein
MAVGAVHSHGSMKRVVRCGDARTYVYVYLADGDVEYNLEETRGVEVCAGTRRPRLADYNMIL